MMIYRDNEFQSFIALKSGREVRMSVWEDNKAIGQFVHLHLLPLSSLSASLSLLEALSQCMRP
jgi:hypothetical protein